MKWQCAYGWIIALASVNMASILHAESLKAVPFQDVVIKDSFWSKRIQTNRTATIEARNRLSPPPGLRHFCTQGEPFPTPM